jgi:cycloeucalenol cycloisomerase
MKRVLSGEDLKKAFKSIKKKDAKQVQFPPVKAVQRSPSPPPRKSNQRVLGIKKKKISSLSSFLPDADLWLAKNPAKRHTEKTFLMLSVLWISVFGLIVALQIYKSFRDLGYMLLGIGVALPFLLVPIVYSAESEKHTPLTQRYFFKANVWIAIFGFVGNYFWTHYFYEVLGAAYTFPVTLMLNQVPLCLYFITHAYFCTYHTLSTIVLRRFWRSFAPKSNVVHIAGSALFIFLMACFTAFMETYTISEVPYYTHKDKFLMYTVGSVFYGIYFIVSFPMFYRLDEKAGEKWEVGRAAVDGLGAAMLVFILLDLWRLALPSITGGSSALFWKGIPYFKK